MKCRKCGKSVYEIKCFLGRINKKGVKGIWECRPQCGSIMDTDERIIAAIEGDQPEKGQG